MLARNATTKCGLGQLFSYLTKSIYSIELVELAEYPLQSLGARGYLSDAGQPSSRSAETCQPVSFDRDSFTAVLDPLRVFQGLTAKQEAFAQARFRGATQSEAYREAYGDEGRNANAISTMASDLDRHPAIVSRVTQLTAERMSKSSLSPLLSQEFVTDGLMRLAMTAEKESVKLGSLIALGKVAGIDLFRETTRVERVDRTAEDVDRELKAKLQALMNGMTIEGSASSVPAAPAAAAKPTPASAKPDRRRKPVAR